MTSTTASITLAVAQPLLTATVGKEKETMERVQKLAFQQAHTVRETLETIHRSDPRTIAVMIRELSRFNWGAICSVASELYARAVIAIMIQALGSQSRAVRIFGLEALAVMFERWGLRDVDRTRAQEGFITIEGMRRRCQDMEFRALAFRLLLAFGPAYAYLELNQELKPADTH